MSSIAQPSTVTIVGGPPITSSRVSLIWTYQHEGRTYDAVTIKRLTVAEVRALTVAQREAEERDPNAAVPFPIFVDDDGGPIPQAVMDGMMDDDLVAVERVAVDFFPARFRARPAASPSASGDDTGQTSDA